MDDPIFDFPLWKLKHMRFCEAFVPRWVRAVRATVMTEPGIYRWKTPHGLQYRVDTVGTTDLTPEHRPRPPSGRRRTS